MSYYLIISIGRAFFEKLLLRRENIRQGEPTTENLPRLNTAESNALCYVGGYIVHKMRRKLNKYLNNTQVGKLFECLTHGHEKSTQLDYTQDWTRKQSRGGLVYINDGVYLFFKRLEELVIVKMPKSISGMTRNDIRKPMRKNAKECLTMWNDFKHYNVLLIFMFKLEGFHLQKT